MQMTAPYFQIHPTQKPQLIQRDCPVQLCCFRQITEACSGGTFLQARLRNCGPQTVRAVFLRAEALDAGSGVLAVRPGLALTALSAQPHALFGENRLLSLGQFPTGAMRVLVEQVLFTGGLSWRQMPPVATVQAREGGI